jgi:transposase-like protein
MPTDGTQGGGVVCMTRPIDNTTKQRIVRMAMQGYSRKEIAQSVRLPIGEVRRLMKVVRV